MGLGLFFGMIDSLGMSRESWFNKVCRCLLLVVVFFGGWVGTKFLLAMDGGVRGAVVAGVVEVFSGVRERGAEEGGGGGDGGWGGDAGEETYDNFGGAWPRAARPPFHPRHTVISEDVGRDVYVYESPGYRFYADEPIEHGASMHFATLFETTREFVRLLPLGMLKSSGERGKPKVLMFGEDEAYYRSGGPRGSAGCYLPMKRLVLVPVSSLQLQRGEEGGFERDERKNHGVLIHELVHQLTPAAYYAYGSLGWFTEGLAEYVGTTPYYPGYFRVDTHGITVVEYISSYGKDGGGGLRLGTTLRLPRLKEFMLMPYDRFSGEGGAVCYAGSLAIVYYFFHMEGGGGAGRITEFLKGLKAGRYGEPALEVLHGGEGFEALEADISRAWARKGLEVTFGR